MNEPTHNGRTESANAATAETNTEQQEDEEEEEGEQKIKDSQALIHSVHAIGDGLLAGADPDMKLKGGLHFFNLTTINTVSS